MSIDSFAGTFDQQNMSIDSFAGTFDQQYMSALSTNNLPAYLHTSSSFPSHFSNNVPQSLVQFVVHILCPGKAHT